MWMNTGGRQLHDHIMAVGLVLLGSAIFVGCDNRETLLMIEQSTEVHAITHASPAQDPSTNVQLGNVIATLKAGERARAVGVYHGQGVDGFQVKLADGTEGLILAGDTFKVVSR